MPHSKSKKTLTTQIPSIYPLFRNKSHAKIWINEIDLSLGTWIKTKNTRSQPDKILRPKEGIKVGLNILKLWIKLKTHEMPLQLEMRRF